MPFFSLSQLPHLALSAVLFYGAFSRLTHGAYTPQWYAYQCARQPDDGSAAALITPIMDLSLGTKLLFPRWKIRVGAAMAFVLMQSIGIAVQISGGKDWTGDALILSLGIAAALSGKLG